MLLASPCLHSAMPRMLLLPPGAPLKPAAALRLLLCPAALLSMPLQPQSAGSAQPHPPAAAKTVHVANLRRFCKAALGSQTAHQANDLSPPLVLAADAIAEPAIFAQPPARPAERPCQLCPLGRQPAAWLPLAQSAGLRSARKPDQRRDAAHQLEARPAHPVLG